MVKGHCEVSPLIGLFWFYELSLRKVVTMLHASGEVLARKDLQVVPFSANIHPFLYLLQ